LQVLGWNDLVQDRDKWQAFVSMVMNILVALNEGSGGFPDHFKNISSSKRT